MSNPNHDPKNGEFTTANGHNAGVGNKTIINHITGQHMRFEPTVTQLSTRIIVALDSHGKTFLSRKPQQVIDHIAKNWSPEDIGHLHHNRKLGYR